MACPEEGFDTDSGVKQKIKGLFSLIKNNGTKSKQLKKQLTDRKSVV